MGACVDATQSVCQHVVNMGFIIGCGYYIRTFSRMMVPTPLPTGSEKIVKAAVVISICSSPSPKAYFASACTPKNQGTIS